MSDPETRMAPNAHAPAPALATLIALTALLALTAAATSWVTDWSWALFAVIGISRCWRTSLQWRRRRC